MSNLATKAAFARLIGRSRSWVTRMAQAQRIVLEWQGSRSLVNVEKSRALLEQTAGNRDDVAARHAEARAKPAAKEREPDFAFGLAAASAPPPAPEGQPATERPPAGPPAGEGERPLIEAMEREMAEARRAKVLAESRRVQAAADREEMERDKLAGDLIAREDVDAAMKFIGASVRSLSEVFADQVAPIVAPMSNLDEVHAALTEARRDELVRLGEAIERQQAALARGGAA